ncbi:MAG: SCO family protein [Thermoleophilaceae bacterium]|nr:SCO family protein [Thermoleophilaceae bacterium]
MNPRLVLAVLVALLFLSGGLVVIALTADRGSGDDALVDGPPDSKSEFAGAKLPDGVRAPDFALEDENGDPIAMKDFRGKPVIVTFLYSSCEDTCPGQAQQVKAALDELGHDVPALAVSVDPENDTPRSAQKFNLEQRVTGRIRWVLGDKADLKKVHKGFFIQAQTKNLDHQARIVLIDRDGFQRVGYPLQQVTPERMAGDLKILEQG